MVNYFGAFSNDDSPPRVRRRVSSKSSPALCQNRNLPPFDCAGGNHHQGNHADGHLQNQSASFHLHGQQHHHAGDANHAGNANHPHPPQGMIIPPPGYMNEHANNVPFPNFSNASTLRRCGPDVSSVMKIGQPGGNEGVQQLQGGNDDQVVEHHQNAIHSASPRMHHPHHSASPRNDNNGGSSRVHPVVGGPHHQSRQQQGHWHSNAFPAFAGGSSLVRGGPSPPFAAGPHHYVRKKK